MPRSIAPASRRAMVLAVVVAFASGAGVAAGSAPPVPPLSSNGNPPACKIADKPAKFTTTSAWSRTLVDWIWKVGSGYKPPVLVPV